MTTLPLFSYPLTVTLVDDDPLMLQALESVLKQSYQLNIFNTPTDAVNYFDSYTPLLPSIKLLHGCTELENYDISGHLPVDVNFNVSKELINHPKRQKETSVIIVDYNMPGINGIELCRKLKSLPLKKILLTGEANDRLAIDAFNEGIIDCFIRKDSPSLADDLHCHLTILTQHYFETITTQLLKHLETDHPLPASDPVFITFFKEWCQAHRIKEYFIIDQNANFVLLNDNNEESFFITHTDRTLRNFIELNEDDQDLSSFIKLISAREKIPFFGNDNESWKVRHTEWDKHLVTPQVLIGREKYYWATIKSEGVNQ